MQGMRKFRNPKCALRKFSKGCQQFANPFLSCETHAKFEKPVQPCEFQQSLCEMLTVNGKAKGHLKQAYLKTSRCLICLYSFRKPIYSWNSAPPCQLVFSPFNAPRTPIWRGNLHLSLHFSHDAHQRRPYRPFSISWGQTKSLRSSGFISGPSGPDRSVFWGRGAL